MTVTEVLELVRAGYTRAEIDAMTAIDQHDDPATDQHDDPAHDDQPEQHDDQSSEQVPAWAQALNATLDDLRKTLQASNIRHDDMGDEDSVVDAAENALAQYITGKVPETKSGGRKTK